MYAYIYSVRLYQQCTFTVYTHSLMLYLQFTVIFIEFGYSYSVWLYLQYTVMLQCTVLFTVYVYIYSVQTQCMVTVYILYIF